MNTTTTETENYTFCWTHERNRKALEGTTWDAYWSARPASAVTVELFAGYTIDEALDAARNLGLFGTGSNRSGCFEVQCDRGIWTHVRGYRNLGKAKAADIVFKTWDEMEAEEFAAAA